MASRYSSNAGKFSDSGGRRNVNNNAGDSQRQLNQVPATIAGAQRTANPTTLARVQSRGVGKGVSARSNNKTRKTG